MDWLLRLEHELYVMACAMLPVIELRGAIPLARISFELNAYEAFFFSVIGNMIPVPFIILFFRKMIDLLKKTQIFQKVAHKLEKKALKSKDKIVKYSTLGLVVLVAIPLPGTGAWTGAMLASLLDLRLKNAVPAIALGVIIAGFIVTAITYGII